jgi:hypothetical protein
LVSAVGVAAADDGGDEDASEDDADEDDGDGFEPVGVPEGSADGSIATAAMSARAVTTSRHVSPLTERVASVPSDERTATCPVARRPRIVTRTASVRASSPGRATRARDVRARSSSKNVAPSGHPAATE